MRKKEQEKDVLKRQREKKEDILAKERAREKIKADHEKRKLKAEAEKAAREGRHIDIAGPATPSKPAAPVHKAAAEYSESRLQLRLPSGQPLIKSFPVMTTLFEVASAIQDERGFIASTFTTTFPRKTYGPTEFGMTLQEAKLVPSAALIIG